MKKNTFEGKNFITMGTSSYFMNIKSKSHSHYHHLIPIIKRRIGVYFNIQKCMGEGGKRARELKNRWNGELEKAKEYKNLFSFPFKPNPYVGK